MVLCVDDTIQYNILDKSSMYARILELYIQYIAHKSDVANQKLHITLLLYFSTNVSELNLTKLDPK